VRKGGKYSDLDEPLENPLIIAVNSRSVFFEDDEADPALFGHLGRGAAGRSTPPL
jgi:hypothetical protein